MANGNPQPSPSKAAPQPAAVQAKPFQGNIAGHTSPFKAVCDQVCTTFSARITYAAGRGNEWGKHWSLIVIFRKQIACSSMRNNWCNQALVSPAQPLITSEQLVSQANNVQQPTYLGCFLHAPAIASSVQQPSVLSMAGHNQTPLVLRT